MSSLPVGALATPGAHGVVVSLPTVADIVRYETGALSLRAGYPRFVEHATVRALTALVAARLGGGAGASAASFCSRPRTFVFDGWTIVLEQISIGVVGDRLPITVRVIKHYAIKG